MIHSKVFALEFLALMITGPFLAWLGVYVAAETGLQLRPALPWKRVLRWISSILAIALFVIHFANQHFPWAYGSALIPFSIGFAFPENWLRRRFAPDLIEPDSTGEYWPSERQ